MSVSLAVPPLHPLSFSAMYERVLGSVETCHTMEFTSFIPQWFSTWTFVLAGAELTEILCCLGDGVGEEVHFYPTEWFAYTVKSESAEEHGEK